MVSIALTGWRIPDWASVLSLPVGLFAAALAVFFYLRPRSPRKRLLWNATTTSIADPWYPGVEVLFEGAVVPRVSQTMVTIENGGLASIQAVDIKTRRNVVPIRIISDVLDATIIRVSSVPDAESYIESRAGVEEEEIFAAFELLEPGDSIQVGILHTGEADVTVEVDAHVVGGKLIRSAPSLAGHSPIRLSTVLAVILVGALIVPLVAILDSRHSDAPGFIGGCKRFKVVAQNRWPPFGAVLRAAPSLAADRERGFIGNEMVLVDGWVHGSPAYPPNSPPWDSDVWFHLADKKGSGWLAYAAVRAAPTFRDTSGRDPDGGPPVELRPECEGKYAG